MTPPRLPLVSLLLAGAVAAVALLGADTQRTEPPPLEETAGEALVVHWVFRPAELITCKTPAYVLRHLRDDLGPNVRVVAYGVGVGEEEARSFLRAERVPAELRTATPEEYRSRYNMSPETGIYIVSGTNIVQAFPAGPNHRYPDVETLRAAVQPYLASADLRGRTITSPPSPPRRTS